jgi:beta-glucosidase
MSVLSHTLHRLCLVVIVAFAAGGTVSTRAATGAPLDDSAATQRADALLAQMTLEEKIGQLNQRFLNFGDPPDVNDVRRGHWGSFLYAEDAAQINQLQHQVMDFGRLHIPLLFGIDVVAGYRTSMPAPLALAASWDPALVEDVDAVAAQEAYAAGIRWNFAPMVDIARDPRWGRMVEGAGEDPYLGAAMAVAQVRGFQGPYIGAPDHLLACVKHMAGYGGAEGGRDYDAAYLSDTQLQNVYLPPFRAAVKAGVGSAMSAYMDLNDVPATGNHWLLTDVLRHDWGFKGFVVSDAFAVASLVTHGFARDRADAAQRALAAGVNMDMAGEVYVDELPNLVASGRIDAHAIDAAVRPILETKIRLGLFEHPYVDLNRAAESQVTPEHRAVALRAAERSAVLLRNDGNLLPLSKAAYRRIALIGPFVDSRQDLLGPWSASANRDDTITIATALRQKLGPGVEISAAPGVQISRRFPSMFDIYFKLPPQEPWDQARADAELKKATDLAAGSDLTVIVLGEAFNMSGEYASESSLELPGRELELLKAVVATGKPVVLVLLNGRPLDLSWEAEHVPAILDAWYPGLEGGVAIADLLFGDATPGGKLPFTWPRDVGQVPIYYAHNLTMRPDESWKFYWNEESTPLYPFGYGLSYAAFTFSNLRVTSHRVAIGGTIGVDVDVENTGARAGDAVAQLYIHQQAGSASRPVRELKGFQRIALAPHQKKTAHFVLGPDELTYWSATRRAWVEEPEQFDLWAGGDSRADLHESFTVTQP